MRNYFRLVIAVLWILFAIVVVAQAQLPGNGPLPFPIAATPAPPSTTVWQFTGAQTQGGALGSTLTFVTKIDNSELNVPPGSTSSVTVQLGGFSTTYNLKTVYIGPAQVGTGTCGNHTGVCAWNFGAAPTNLRNCSSSCTIGSSGVTLTGAYVHDPTKPLMLAFDINIGGGVPLDAITQSPVVTSPPVTATANCPSGLPPTKCYNSYQLASVQEAGTQLKATGYTGTAAQVRFVQSVTVQ